MATTTVRIFSDRQAWTHRAVRACSGVGVMPEAMSWERATLPSARPVAILADAGTEAGLDPTPYRAWAERRLQPIALVSLENAPGTNELETTLQQLGYERRVRDGAGPTHWRRLRRALQEVVEARLWLASWAGEALGTRDPAVLRALSVALALLPELTTVNAWAERLETRRQRLHELFAANGLPSPKWEFELLRLARAIVAYEESGGHALRKEIAAAAGYRSPGQLRHWCLQLTGRPLARVLESGLEGLAALLPGGG